MILTILSNTGLLRNTSTNMTNPIPKKQAMEEYLTFPHGMYVQYSKQSGSHFVFPGNYLWRK